MERISPAKASDLPLIYKFIQGLAEYERLPMAATEESIGLALFGERPFAEVVIGYLDEVPAGFALFFPVLSTFLGKPGIYLEDLFVLPEHRGKGLGKALLRYVGGLALERECAYVEWGVLDWNTPSIEFYKGLGARPLAEWTKYRLQGDDLRGLCG
ncbi:MAG TPA: GNAT family N-acetyltransferase [Bryobacteraceae bacterium]|nr:GNAT family N-acetyltransferase [Bryobacteraceae bacterium]